MLNTASSNRPELGSPPPPAAQTQHWHVFLGLQLALACVFDVVVKFKPKGNCSLELVLSASVLNPFKTRSSRHLSKALPMFILILTRARRIGRGCGKGMVMGCATGRVTICSRRRRLWRRMDDRKEDNNQRR